MHISNTFPLTQPITNRSFLFYKFVRHTTGGVKCQRSVVRLVEVLPPQLYSHRLWSAPRMAVRCQPPARPSIGGMSRVQQGMKLDILSNVKVWQQPEEQIGLEARVTHLTKLVGLEISFVLATMKLRKSEHVCKFEEAWCLPLTELAQAFGPESAGAAFPLFLYFFSTCVSIRSRRLALLLRLRTSSGTV